MTRRFEYTNEKSNKFWEITISGKIVSVQYGRIGTDGQTQEKAYPTPVDAKKAANKQILEKVKKGYREVGQQAAPARKSDPAKKPSTKKAPAKKAPARRNGALVARLKALDASALVSITAHLQHGCIERGSGSGEYNDYGFTQEYTTMWSDGTLESTADDGITVGDVIDVLQRKTLSEIGSEDFVLRPGGSRGGLMNGNSRFETTWDDEAPEPAPSDHDLYGLMDLSDATYEWRGARSLDFEVHPVESRRDSTYFSLTTDKAD